MTPNIKSLEGQGALKEGVWIGGLVKFSMFLPSLGPELRDKLSGPMRDNPPPYRAIPFRHSIAEGGIAPIGLVFIGYRTSIAEIPLLWGVWRLHFACFARGKLSEKGRGYRTQLAMLRHQQPHSTQ